MDIYKKYDLRDKINKIKPEIIEALVKVRGENNRKLIEDGVNSIEIISYISGEHLKNYIQELEKNKKEGLTNKFLKSLGLETIKEDDLFSFLKFEISEESDKRTEILKLCFGDLKYSLNRKIDINQLFSEEYILCKPEKERYSIIKKRVDILNYFGANVSEENYEEVMQRGSIDDIIKKVTDLQKLVHDLDDEYKDFFEQYKSEFLENQRNEYIKSKLYMDNTIEYYNELRLHLPEKVQKELKRGMKIENWLYDHGFSDSISSAGIVECFSSESSKALESSTDSKVIDEIKSKRINFFKRRGINLGDKYEDYMANLEAQSLIPDQLLIDKIIELRNKYDKKFKIKTIKQTGSYSKDYARLNELGSMEQIYAPSLINDNLICVEPTTVERDGIKKSLPIVFIPVLELIGKEGVWYGRSDVAIIHEIGHAIEDELIKTEDEGYVHKNGFDFLKAEYEKSNEEEELTDKFRKKREFEISNEAINQKLAIEATDILHSRGIFIIDTPENCKVKGSMLMYERAFKIIAPFFNEFRQLVIDARMSEKKLKEFESSQIYSQFFKINSLCKEFGNMSDFFETYKEGTPEAVRYQEMIQEALTLTDQAKLLDTAISESMISGFQGMKNSKIMIEKYMREKQRNGYGELQERKD